MSQVAAATIAATQACPPQFQAASLIVLTPAGAWVLEASEAGLHSATWTADATPAQVLRLQQQLAERAGAKSNDASRPIPPHTHPKVEHILNQAKDELLAYLDGRLTSFTVSLAPQGTPFQQRVWQALVQIPHGETRSYGAIARAIGQPKAARAVGMANHHNPLTVFVPCHRVVGANGTLVGYAGGLDRKRWLLQHEREVATTV